MVEPLVLPVRVNRIEQGRRTIGLLTGPLVALLISVLPLHGLTLEAHRLASIAALVIFGMVAYLGWRRRQARVSAPSSISPS